MYKVIFLIVVSVISFVAAYAGFYTGNENLGVPALVIGAVTGWYVLVSEEK